MKKLLIIDSNSLINRAFYGVRFLSASDGTPTNAIFGFMMTLMKLIDENKPDYICAAAAGEREGRLETSSSCGH